MVMIRTPQRLTDPSYSSTGSDFVPGPDTTKVLLHTANLGYTEDPQIALAEPAYHFERSNAGQWCKNNGIEMFWKTDVSPVTLSFIVVIYAWMTDSQKTEWLLRYGN